jgi:hypothetical protein
VLLFLGLAVLGWDTIFPGQVALDLELVVLSLDTKWFQVQDWEKLRTVEVLDLDKLVEELNLEMMAQILVQLVQLVQGLGNSG